MLPWYKRTLRFAQTNLTENDPAECDLSFWRKYWKEQKVQGVVINCGGIVSYYQSQYAYQYKAEYLGERDYFAEFSQAAREDGLVVIARMDINCTSEALYREHPKWYCRDRDGKVIKTQGRYVACVNGGYYNTFIPDVLREIISKYKPEGFADNSWSGLDRKTVCYCDNCREAFREALSRELPVRADWEDRGYREWIRWNYRRRVEIWKYFNKVTQLAGGEDCGWYGMLNADPFRTGGRFYDIRELVREAPFIFCDHQSRDAENGFEQNALNGALLRMAADENILVTESMAHYYKGIRTFRLSSAPAQEVRKWMLTGIAGGVQPWCHFVGGGTQDGRKFKLTDDIYRWHEKNQAYLSGRRNLATVGIVWSQENTVYYGREAADEKSALPFAGFARALSKTAIPFVPVHAEDIDRYADRLETIVLPDLAIMTQGQQEAVIRFLEQGKHVVMTGRTGLADWDGEIRGSSILWDYLGLRHSGQTLGVQDWADSKENWLRHDAHNYLRITDKMDSIFKGFEETELLPFGGRIEQIESSGLLRGAGSYIPAFPIYPPEFSWIREEEPAVPPFYGGELKNGARVVYLAADIDRCYGKYQIPDHKKLLVNCITYASKGKFPVYVQSEGVIHCDLYEQDGQIILHLVNLSGCEGPLGTQEHNFPVGPVTVILEPGMELHGTAELTVEGGQRELYRCGQTWRLELERLEEHEMILLR